MYNKSMRRSRLARTILAGTLGAVLAVTSAVTALADEIIVEDAAPAAEDEGIIEASSDASGVAKDDQPTAATHVSVHDPSIVRSNEDGTCYVLGSHTASAKSSDLIQWTQINFDYGNPENTPFYGNLQETFQVPFRWAGYNDGDCVGGYAIWAPDVIWNPYYEWEDGSTGAYMLYCCTSSTWRRSCISYLVSKTIDGTYTYVDTIVYSGFTKTGDPDGNSSRNTKWDNDYLNLTALIEKGSEGGGIDEISDSWFDAAGGWNKPLCTECDRSESVFRCGRRKALHVLRLLVRRSFPAGA